MGVGNGPQGQALDNIAVRLDLGSTQSYGGTGNTANSLVKSDLLQFTGGVTFSSAGASSSFTFAGAGVVTSRSNVGVSGAASRSMSCWVKFSAKQIQGIMSTGANGAGTGMALQTSSTQFQLGYGNSGAATTITYDTGIWYNLTYVSELVSGSTHRLKLYVNGGLAHTAVFTSINLTDSTLRIGCDNAGTKLSGDISRATFYNKALTDTEISKMYRNYRGRFGLRS